MLVWFVRVNVDVYACAVELYVRVRARRCACVCAYVIIQNCTPHSAVAAVTRNRDAVTSRGGPWPRLVVRDPSGRTLDTFTTLQDAIYRASWTVKVGHPHTYRR